MANISVVDISKIGLDAGDPSAEDLLSVGRDIVAAFRGSGFAYLQGHGVSQQLQDKTFADAKGFFQLSEQEKLQYERFVKTGFNGYTPIGGENNAYANEDGAYLIDYKECYDLHVKGEDYPSAVCPALGPQLELFGSHCCRLTERLLAALDAALGSGQLLTSCHRRQLQPGGCSEMRVLYYPPVPDGLPEGTVRCGEHTDYGTFTLLFQDDIGGLELLTPDQKWEPAAPVPGTILVNIGDMMELWTAGQLRATKHRVSVPAGERRRAAARQSVVFFVVPDDKTIVAPLSGDPSYQPVDAGAFLRKQFAATYPKFSEMRVK
ncbi:UPF0676 protein [Amphibalanus amphitrite]|uniref:UPF0676 protein n=1 Tax=Amphibalanus amphitrite TaxID=1232801 RepID=A0A6A4WH71_AMPAM|nr:UPF0676 protein [Amphibalanus amphitrite]